MRFPFEIGLCKIAFDVVAMQAGDWAVSKTYTFPSDFLRFL